MGLGSKCKRKKKHRTLKIFFHNNKKVWIPDQGSLEDREEANLNWFPNKELVYIKVREGV